MKSRIEIETPTGTAWADLDHAADPTAVMFLGHGAGGGVDAPDLVAVRTAVLDVGVSVASITQPYRVAGRRTPPTPTRLDEAWLAVISEINKKFDGLPVVNAGRSSGARVACRTAAAVGASAVVALAFPVHPPGKPEKSRLDELDQPRVPVLVVQGDRDAFGMPPKSRKRRLVVIPGADHSLKKDRPAVAVAVCAFLATHGLTRTT